MQRLAKVVSDIHRRHQQEEGATSHDQPDSNRFQPADTSEKVYADIFLRNDKSFVTYREPIEEYSNKTRHIPNSRRSKLLSDDRDESLSRNVDLELIKFEQNRKLEVEKSVLHRKERLTRLIENLR